MESDAHDEGAHQDIVRAAENPRANESESGHDPQDASASFSRARDGHMIALAEELGRLAADLYAEGRLSLHVERSTKKDTKRR